MSDYRWRYKFELFLLFFMVLRVNKRIFRLKKSDFIEITCCPLCGSKDKKVLRTQKNILIYQEIYPKYSLVVPDSFSKRELLRCQDCGHVYWGLIPRFEVIPSYKAEIIDYGFDESRALNKKAELLNGLLISNGLLVDIGACRGELLSAIRSINHNVTLLGIEPSLGIENSQDNIRIIQALFNEDVPLAPKSVDVFSAFDCFEHMPRLDEGFGAVNLFIKEGGYLYIETPDGDYPFNHLIGGNNINLFWVEHFSFLTRASIRFICNKYGYEIVSIENVAHVETGIVGRAKSMVKAFAKYTLMNSERPMYVNCRDHLKIIMRKI